MALFCMIYQRAYIKVTIILGFNYVSHALQINNIESLSIKILAFSDKKYINWL